MLSSLSSQPLHCYCSFISARLHVLGVGLLYLPRKERKYQTRREELVHNFRRFSECRRKKNFDPIRKSQVARGFSDMRLSAFCNDIDKIIIACHWPGATVVASRASTTQYLDVLLQFLTIRMLFTRRRNSNKNLKSLSGSGRRPWRLLSRRDAGYSNVSKFEDSSQPQQLPSKVFYSYYLHLYKTRAGAIHVYV